LLRGEPDQVEKLNQEELVNLYKEIMKTAVQIAKKGNLRD
jgi:hypothetical protein